MCIVLLIFVRHSGFVKMRNEFSLWRRIRPIYDSLVNWWLKKYFTWSNSIVRIVHCLFLLRIIIHTYINKDFVKYYWRGNKINACRRKNLGNSLHAPLINQNAKDNINNNQDRIDWKRTAKVSLILRAIIGAFKNVDHTTQLCTLLLGCYTSNASSSSRTAAEIK